MGIEANRDAALDAFRGLAVAGMIVVNNSGPGRPVYAPFAHAPWHGWTSADLVFPAFLFAVGVSITYSLRKHVPAPPWGVHVRIVRRAALLFALGLLLVAFPYYDLDTWRVPGVLQRIALCYLAASVLYLHSSWRTQAIVAGLVILGYWTLLALVPAPGHAAGDLSPEGNIAGRIDRALLGAHMEKPFDAEGPVGTLPALATTLTGVLAGTWLHAARAPVRKICCLAAAGLAFAALGAAWDRVLPINKSLWTGSYVALTSGAAALGLAALHWLIGLRGLARLAKPLEILGANALALYAGAYLAQRLLFSLRVAAEDGSRPRLRELVFERAVDPFVPGALGTLAYCLGFLFVFWLALALLYRRRIFLRL